MAFCISATVPGAGSATPSRRRRSTAGGREYLFQTVRRAFARPPPQCLAEKRVGGVDANDDNGLMGSTFRVTVKPAPAFEFPSGEPDEELLGVAR
jgi:hypothetical protein